MYGLGVFRKGIVLDHVVDYMEREVIDYSFE
jgi:hypothetical protein